MNRMTCQKCVNFIDDDGLLSCDFDYFNDVKQDIGILYVPEMFDCLNFELSSDYADNK